MKRPGARGHIRLLLQVVLRGRALAQSQVPPSKPGLAEIYAQHSEFLWKSLYRLGVPEADLPDVLQEVLLVVHRRLDSFDASCRLTTWLFGICLRVTATARRTVRRRREQPLDESAQEPMLSDSPSPEDLMVARDAKQRLNAALDCLEPDKRAVFVMFELEGIACAEIAEMLGVPKGTVFSRLASARNSFLQALARLDKMDQRKSLAMGGHR